MKAITLVINPGEKPFTFLGFETHRDKDGVFFRIPEIAGLPKEKFIIRPDYKEPAQVHNRVIYDLFFKMYGGRKINDPKAVIAAVKPNKVDTKIAILAPKRWPELGLKNASPNIGGFVPGVLFLDRLDSFEFTWEGKEYRIENIDGENLEITDLQECRARTEKRLKEREWQAKRKMAA